MGLKPVELHFLREILESLKRRAMLPLKKLPKRSQRSQSARGLDSKSSAEKCKMVAGIA